MDNDTVYPWVFPAEHYFGEALRELGLTEDNLEAMAPGEDAREGTLPWGKYPTWDAVLKRAWELDPDDPPAPAMWPIARTEPR